ncbi:hypothetical protein D9O36_03310 [Zobellia amurskyensis]|uniref:Lipoprotein n=1 Tax=Zobellia amurskyensis TaxID=248905 RepID=A0A7X2ZR68_9FLAO|nr:hypothetical protein [Zobellia amurskyensis]MUH34859.1 hypothetical protein [Zobellia amurskyensis]
MKNSQKFVQKCTALILLLIITSCVEDKNTPCPDCPCEPVLNETYDNGIILPEKAHKLYANYENRRVDLIQKYEDAIDEREKDPKQQNQQKIQNSEKENNSEAGTERFKVARYVSYNYKDLKEYLAYIENEAKLSGEELTTMRFYFANYANEKKYKNGKPVQHPRQNTIMMSPTVNKDGTDHIFYTDDAEDGKRRIVLLDDNFNPRKGEKVNQMDSNTKNEASFLPGFFSSSNAPFFAARSTTKNEGSSHP